MADITVAATDVRPPNLIQTLTRRFALGGAANIGNIVYVAADGDVEQADASAVGSAQGIGVIVAINGTQQTSGVAGDTVDVALFGPVVWGSGMTPGAVVYVSETAGAGDQTAPSGGANYPYVIGRALTATMLFVDPQNTVPAVST